VAILLAWWIYSMWGKPMTELELIALSSVTGSLTSALALCFWDLRAMLLSFVHRRRRADKRK
jgi:hypothetical protein